MIISYKNDLVIESHAAKEYLPQLTKEFLHLIEELQFEIQQINALEGDEIKDALKNIVISHFENADPDRIIDGFLSMNEEPYNEFLESESSGWNLDLITQVTEKNTDRYTILLQEFLDENKLTTDFGEYTVQLDSLTHESGLASAYEVAVLHENEMKGEVVVRSTGDTQQLEEDAVGLEEFARTIEPEYIKLDVSQLESDLQDAYLLQLNDDFIPEHHLKFLESMHGYMKTCCG